MSEHEHEIRTRVTGIMGSPNAVDVRHAEAITKALDALLAEHRAEVERLTRERDEANAFQHAQALRDAERIERTWAEALEMVAAETERRASLARRVYVGTEKAPMGEGAGDALETLAASIRADITTSAPATIPVERVREECLRMIDRGGPWAFAANAIARRLGVGLDAKGEAPPDACGKWFAGGVCRQRDGHEGAHQYETPPDDVATEPHPDAIPPERNLCGRCDGPASQHDERGRRYWEDEGGGHLCTGFRHVEQEGSKP